LKSPRASRSALSRWISSGQGRSLSFSLSSPPLLFTSFSSPRRPPFSLGHEGGEDEARRYLLSFPCPQRNDHASAAPLHGGVRHCARLPPRASLAHNDRDGKTHEEDGVLLLLRAARYPRLHPRAHRNDSRICIYVINTCACKRASACTCMHACIGTCAIVSPAFACIARGRPRKPLLFLNFAFYSLDGIIYRKKNNEIRIIYHRGHCRGALRNLLSKFFTGTFRFDP